VYEPSSKKNKQNPPAEDWKELDTQDIQDTALSSDYWKQAAKC